MFGGAARARRRRGLLEFQLDTLLDLIEQAQGFVQHLMTVTVNVASEQRRDDTEAVLPWTSGGESPKT
jgi:hypothetical protein